MSRCGLACFFVIASGWALAQPEARILDLKHYSATFGEERNFRIFLPPDYEANAPERYPVIYFFHGWSERHNKPPRGGKGYDSGQDYGGDNIARFVGANKVIVVKWDGYNPRTPGEDYPRPYNISPVETYRQFPLYFPELVSHIDTHFRTIADREHRATAGLSMGGFMSFWVAGKYPHLVGSASNFMGSSEFYAGPNGFPTEYRHTELYRNYEGVRTRHVTGAKDFIRWYHKRMNAVWSTLRPNHEHEQFDHEHGTPGMAKTLEFHMKAFRDPLPRPSLWHHADVYPVFDVWGYSVQTDRQTPGFTLLENVSRSGFRASVREWLPAGRLLPAVAVRVSTDAVYTPKKTYRVTDVNVSTREVKHILATSDTHGRLHVDLNGALHEIGISPAAQAMVTVAGWRVANTPWATNGESTHLRLKLLNKGTGAARQTRGTLMSRTSGVRVVNGTFPVPALGVGDVAETRDLAVELDAAAREFVRLAVELDGVTYPIEVPVFAKPDPVAEPVVLDGLKAKVWRRAIHQVETTLGTGNGDGKTQAGEEVVLAVRDGAALRPVEVLTSDPCLDISERVSDPWGGYDNVGATAKYTVVHVSSTCDGQRTIPVLVEYQIPNKPEHILKQGVVSITVGGTDRTPPQVKRARVAGLNRLEVLLSDGAAVRNVTAVLQKGTDHIRVPLNDEGRGGDRASGDSVFSGVAPNPAPGHYVFRIEAEDAFGNAASNVLPGDYEFQLPSPAPALVR